jgi:hypothetical protein
MGNTEADGSTGSSADHRRSFGASSEALSDQRLTSLQASGGRMVQDHAGGSTHAPKGEKK